MGRKVTTQIVLFVLVAVVGLSVVAVRYVQLPRILGLSGYTVTLDLPDTGGAYTDADVSYRGSRRPRRRHPPHRRRGPGRPAHRRRRPRIPSALTVVVANRSAVGEQYVDLRPTADPGPDGPWLAAGAHVSVPPPTCRRRSSRSSPRATAPSGRCRRTTCAPSSTSSTRPPATTARTSSASSTRPGLHPGRDRQPRRHRAAHRLQRHRARDPAAQRRRHHDLLLEPRADLRAAAGLRRRPAHPHRQHPRCGPAGAGADRRRGRPARRPHAQPRDDRARCSAPTPPGCRASSSDCPRPSARRTRSSARTG